MWDAALNATEVYSVYDGNLGIASTLPGAPYSVSVDP